MLSFAAYFWPRGNVNYIKLQAIYSKLADSPVSYFRPSNGAAWPAYTDHRGYILNLQGISNSRGRKHFQTILVDCGGPSVDIGSCGGASTQKEKSGQGQKGGTSRGKQATSLQTYQAHSPPIFILSSFSCAQGYIACGS